MAGGGLVSANGLATALSGVVAALGRFAGDDLQDFRAALFVSVKFVQRRAIDVQRDQFLPAALAIVEAVNVWGVRARYGVGLPFGFAGAAQNASFVLDKNSLA